MLQVWLLGEVPGVEAKALFLGPTASEGQQIDVDTVAPAQEMLVCCHNRRLVVSGIQPKSFMQLQQRRDRYLRIPAERMKIYMSMLWM